MAYEPNNNTPGNENQQDKIAFPPGLVGAIANFIFEAAPHQNRVVALAGAITIVAGITGRVYNTHTKAGLNQYILMLARTGIGKDAFSNGSAKLMKAVQKSVPAAGEFKGPALVSSAGLIKWLAKYPSIYSEIGEVGYLMKRLASERANPNDQMLLATLLTFYSKSGAGNIYDPMAYSDPDKRTAVIHSPSLTLFGETAPSSILPSLDERMVVSGLLPRFLVFETAAKREYSNENMIELPPEKLVQSLADLCAHCLAKNQQNHVHVVEANDQAKAEFRKFDKWTTDQINEAQSESQRELWNRAHLKALKLAALCAVGINPFAPIVTIDEATWAINLVVGQTNNLIAKFENGETGEVAGNEVKQQAEVARIVKEYTSNAFTPTLENYGVQFEMHRDGVFTEAYLSRRLIKLPTFNDRMGATAALKRALKAMTDADDLREIAGPQMTAKYGRKPRAFAIANPGRFK